MSASIEDDDSLSFDENQDENSDCASSRASSLKRPRSTTAQIRSTAWVLRGEITPVLQNNSLFDLMACHAQEEDQLQKNTKLHMEAALGAKFEVLFQK